MSPIDDELRTTLSSRTDALSVSPDLFTGIERRATRMRRQRVAATVAGSALAVTALGLGGPMVASSLTSTAPGPSQLATQAPPSDDDRYALDPADPWPYRGEIVVRAPVEGVASQDWALRRGTTVDEVDFTLLYGELSEPSGDNVAVSVFVARGPEGTAHWGVVQTDETGVEFLVDEPLAPGTRALAAALPGQEVSRLLVVAAPSVVDLEYAYDAESEWSAMTVVESGVGVTPLDGDVATDRYRVISPEGDLLVDAPAPDGEAVEGEPEGPGTQTPVAVDTAPYALDLNDPWAYRGPAEATLHPDLGVQDERLFVERGTGRDDGSWSQRPLLLVEDEASGQSVLMVLHRSSGGEAYVTTTWRTQDEAPRQSEQPVYEGQLLVQTVLPDAGPAGVLLALASPEAGAVETDLAAAGSGGVTTGVGIFELPADPPPGSVSLYTEGDGLLYHSEPARRS